MELRIRVANQLGVGWNKLELERQDAKLPHHLNGLTLAEIAIKDHEKLKTVKKSPGYVPRVDLVDGQGVLVEKVRRIFEKWFAQHSSNNLMSQHDCAVFLASCTNEPCLSTDNRIVNLFARFDEDQDGWLTLQDFLSTLLTQTSTRTPRTTARRSSGATSTPRTSATTSRTRPRTRSRRSTRRVCRAACSR